MTASNLLFRLLLGLVVLAPLPLGSNRPWAWSLLAVAVGFLIVAWAILTALGSARAPVPFSRLWPMSLPFGVVLAWSFVQTLPGFLPSGYWHPMWVDAARALAGPHFLGLVTSDPALTMSAILRLTCYGAIFWLSAQLGRERTRAHEALVVLSLAGSAYAAYGLLVHFVGWETILWMPKWAYPGDLTATFVNRNAYGAYAGLGLLTCAALFIHSLQPLAKGRHGRSYGAFDIAETVILRAMPYLLGVLVIGSALLLSHSRGAMLATGVALGTLLVTAATAGVMRPRAAVLMSCAVLVVGGAALAISGDVTIERLVEDTSTTQDADRLNTYRLALVAIADSPMTGNGLGAFLPTFRVYRDVSVSGATVWDYAHNVHLELAMDLGLPATILLYLSFGAVIFSCFAGLIRRHRDQIFPALAIGAAVLLGVHGLVDFSVQMPAIAATFALLLGIGFAQSWNSDRRETTDASSEPRKARAAEQAS